MVETSELNVDSDVVTAEFRKPSFPPDLCPEDLIGKAIERLKKTGKLSKISNAFLAYRMAIRKQYSNEKRYKRMHDLSSMAANAWRKEPQRVKSFYHNLSRKALDQYRRFAASLFPLHIVQLQIAQKSQIDGTLDLIDGLNHIEAPVSHENSSTANGRTDLHYASTTNQYKNNFYYPEAHPFSTAPSTLSQWPTDFDQDQSFLRLSEPGCESSFFNLENSGTYEEILDTYQNPNYNLVKIEFIGHKQPPAIFCNYY
ncbi:hypothetical protein G9A89_016893 [Geosiphon pyriformis]|nr:hypothetical protein G9A89_016893 [Geosiphon pyriformis]